MAVNVVVVGLLSAQTRRLACRVDRSKVRLRFLGSERRGESLASDADWCVLMSKFVSHCVRDSFIRRLGRSRVIDHMGGNARLLELVESLLETGSKPRRH